MNRTTDVYFNAEDVGKKVYRKRTYYTLCVEQDVLASNPDEADDKFLEGGGINHSNIGRDLTDENKVDEVEKPSAQTWGSTFTDSDFRLDINKVLT